MSRASSVCLRISCVILGLAVACASAHSSLEIRSRAPLMDETGLAGLRLWLDSRQYTAADFERDADGRPAISAEVPNAGDLRISMELTQGGEVVASGSFALAMSPDFEWGMDLFRQAQNPLPGCLGCFGAQAFLISEIAQNEAGEAIWFAWGGRPRDSDIVH